LALYNYSKTSGHDQLLVAISHNWHALVLLGVIIVSVVVSADYFSSAKMFATMEPDYAQKSLTSAREIKNKIEEIYGQEKREERLYNMQRDVQSSIGRMENSFPLTRDELLNLRSGEFLYIAMTSRYQRNWGILNTTMSSLTLVQLFFALLTAYILITSAVLQFWIVRADGTNANLGPAIDSAKFALLLFSIYVPCFAYFNSEMNLITKFSSTTHPHVLVTALVVFLAMGFSIIEKDVGAPHTFILKNVLVLIPAFGVIGLNFSNPLFLRPYIGIEAQWGTRVIVFIITLIVCVGVLFSNNLHTPSDATNSTSNYNKTP
jgi:hypothetical protein